MLIGTCVTSLDGSAGGGPDPYFSDESEMSQSPSMMGKRQPAKRTPFSPAADMAAIADEIGDDDDGGEEEDGDEDDEKPKKKRKVVKKKTESGATAFFGGASSVPFSQSSAGAGASAGAALGRNLFCVKCGSSLAGKPFCGNCGEKQF